MASNTPQKVWFRRTGHGTPPSQDGSITPIPFPATDLETLKTDGDSFTLNSFTTDDAWDLGHLLHARLKPFAARGRPALISISLANSGQVVFQCVTGSGITPDHETWVRRKRNAVLRWTRSTWHLSLEFRQDEQAFKKVFQLSEEQASQYAIHGGAVPIRVHGVEGIVAVVIVSGLKQEEDHGVIVDVIKQNWEARDA
ncbi:hypothetical protein B0T16DRAFT_455821 [Cercophora newfieldiana]|uniref:DUF967 domain protein n=1 Tax=Cercophora newfieldiana TaxID=92897 RepID=A0AA40CRU0_9PEZI|nr:hypothetical protein B0T16DRAFT_455821 [Cercophora newfieldiana]